MFDEVLVCLDGSPLAETILPSARAIATPKGGTLTLLRIVRDSAELSAERITCATALAKTALGYALLSRPIQRVRSARNSKERRAPSPRSPPMVAPRG